MSRAVAQLQQYQANNRGALPTDYVGFVTNYMVGDSGDDFTDPGGTAYSFVAKTPTTTGAPIDYPTAANGEIYYYIGYTCDGEDVKEVTAGASSSQRRIALVYKLENAGRVCESL